MKRLLFWIRIKLFGPTIQESLTDLIKDKDEETYKNSPPIQGVKLDL